MAGANLATPLYAVYAGHFRFSDLVLTSVFATYAFVLVPALILFGRPGDVAAGSGHGVAFLNAQEELNDIAPAQRHLQELCDLLRPEQLGRLLGGEELDDQTV